MSLVGGLHHKMIAAVTAAGGVGYALYKFSTPNRDRYISWQHFRTELLPRGAVLKINMREDRCAEIFLNEEQKLLLVVPSIEGFERKLIAEQMQLGVDPANWIEVKHTKVAERQHMLLNLAIMVMWGGVLYYSFSSVGRNAMRGMDGIKNTTSFKVNKADHVKTSFKDVAGLEAPKQEVMEFVSFLKDPERFTKLGAKVPNGVMLMGPPGTGKTLLAKAVAGESKVPFISASGSDFVEMFVGVGPARVRSLFSQARKHGTCIIYIDEIDAIGRPRGRGIASGGNDERENTLNQLLVEMDGFEKDRGKVVVMASTNVAPDQLDSALLRPGRFDRSIMIDRPEVRERQEIFYVHLAKLKLQSLAELRQDEADRKQRTEAAGGSYTPETEQGPSEEETATIKSKTENDPTVVYHLARRLANLTPGMVGADIANVCNEGALIAAREKATTISLNHMERAIDRVIGGIERKSKVLSPFERQVVAYHEAGHAVAGWFLKYADPLMKITIIPRGVAALGYAQYLPKDSKIQTAEQLLDRICVLLGGRCSELLHFNHLSTGAQDDLRKVTSIAYTKVATLGMFEGGGHISFPPPGQDNTMVKPYSDEMAQLFDQEVKKLVDRAFERTQQLLQEKSKEVKLVAEYLLKHEVITRDEFQRLVGPRPEGFDSLKES